MAFMNCLGEAINVEIWLYFFRVHLMVRHFKGRYAEIIHSSKIHITFFKIDFYCTIKQSFMLRDTYSRHLLVGCRRGNFSKPNWASKLALILTQSITNSILWAMDIALSVIKYTINPPYSEKSSKNSIFPTQFAGRLIFACSQQVPIFHNSTI